MRRKTKRIISIVTLVAVLSAGIIVIANSGSAPDFEIQEDQRKKAYDLLDSSLSKSTFVHDKTYIDFLYGKNIDYTYRESDVAKMDSPVNQENNNYGYTNGNIYTLEYGDSVDYIVNVPVSGYYELEIDYRVVGKNVLTNQTIGIKVNDEYQYVQSSTIDVPLYWKDETKDFPLDSYGDETIPSSVRIDEWKKLEIYDNQYSTATPLLFYLTDDSNGNKITISSVSSSGILALGQLKAKSPQNIVSYANYKKEIDKKTNNIGLQKGLIKVNATEYTEKNSSYVRLEHEASPDVKPYSTDIRELNVISGTSWQKSGQSVSFEVEVENTGYYQLGFHFVNDKNEYAAFRSVHVDGKIPFTELKNYAFPHTGNTWSNTFLQDAKGNPYYIYLESGKHTISLRVEMESVYDIINDLQIIADHINYFALEILKVTGNDIDMDKDWELTKYIPETEDYLKAYDTLLKSIITRGREYSKKKADSSLLSYIQKAIVTLDELMEEPNELPLYLENLYSGTSSINALVGESINLFSSQPMSLDMMYVYGNKKLPRATQNFFKSLAADATILLDSFFSDKYKQSIDDEDEDVLTIWVNRPMTYIDIMQNMIDRQFEKGTIKLAIMPDASKLLLANAAGTTPDMAMGLGSHMPFDFAIRNAAYDLSQFPDFWQVINDNNFAPGTLVSYVLNDKIYGLPETLDFNVMMYREDIFNSFGIDVPDTYQEMIGILPTLQRYGMNYYMPISSSNATKWFYQTAPLIYQNGGSLYNANGTATMINSEEAVAGITLLTELFTKYSLSTSVNSFYNSFRNGTQPIGTASFSDYLMMKNAAPELNGKWKITLPIGTEQKDGSVNRTYISNGAASMVFADTNKPQRCWDFLKWWSSTEVQTEFGYTLQSTYGPEYLWLSCNMDAVANSPLDSKDKQVILESLEYIIDIPRTPGQYMLERGLSNIWTQVVLSNEPVRGSIDTAVISINREITRKLNEFGYTNGYPIRESDWVREMIALHSKEGN